MMRTGAGRIKPSRFDSLLFALADLDTGEGHGLAADFLEQLADGLGRILDERLLKQDDFLVEGVERPSTIFGTIFSGLPSARDFSVATRRSDSTTSAGTSSRLSHLAPMAEICRAAS